MTYHLRLKKATKKILRRPVSYKFGRYSGGPSLNNCHYVVVVNNSKAKKKIVEKIQQISIGKGLLYDNNIKSQTYNKNV